MNPVWVLMAIAAGMGGAAQAAINARLGLAAGGQPVAASLISFAVGMIALSGLALFVVDWGTMFAQIGRAPWWSWLGGLIGAGFVLTSVIVAPRMGVANMVFLFILGQLVAGMVIDGFGLLGMPTRTIAWWKFAGLGLMLGGLTLFMFGNRFFQRG